MVLTTAGTIIIIITLFDNVIRRISVDKPDLTVYVTFLSIRTKTQT